MAVTLWSSPGNVLLTVTAALTALLVVYLIWTLMITRRAWRYCGHHVYFIPRIPVIGNAFQLVNLKTSADMWNFVTSYGDRYKQGAMFWLLHIPWLFVTELDVVESVLTSSESIEKSHVYRLLNTVTDGVFTANGLRWKKLRKKLNLTFSQRQIDMIYDDVNQQTAICVEILKKNTGKYINIMTFMTTYFFDIVTRTHFGVETFEQTNRKSCTTEVAAKIIELTIEQRVFKPQNHILPVFMSTRVSQFINYIAAKPLDFIRQIVEDRVEMAKIEKAKGVIDERKKLIYVDGVREALEDLNIKPTVYNLERNTGDMLIAASDTTSVAVSAVFYYLALYQDIQEKVFQEVLPIFGDNSTKEFTRDDLNRMEYLEMVIKETLRHTAPPGIIRELSKDLNVGKYIIPRGTNVYIVIKSIHNNPDYYERPADFYPEHFTPTKVKERPKFAFLAFSQGPRNCPGMAYSYVTMKAVISSVIRNFKLETNIPLKDIKYKMVLMQEHKNGYFVRLTPR